ncbi:hypothetical protein [Fusobacterium hwasookii]|uniref:hypothetical protein n=1 Tax=Fusobacterium hwasookii TaxID=1583098 RepID=UPI000494E863|nr:hypothetical protein [Fusobacterium hwasookii]
MEEKRRGYKTQKQQTEATKRYLEKNPEAKAKANRSRLKSTCLRFIKEFATIEELEELEELLKDKLGGNKMNFNEFEKEIKIIEEKTGMVYKFNENTDMHTFTNNKKIEFYDYINEEIEVCETLDEKIEFYDYLDEKEMRSDYRRIIKEMKEYFKIK